ncbi:MAG TPA: biopolymer transporter ExbD [Planctomycetaceae bacterium]|nr:biopolymer transporter ExbD [Planctomycetaceae bacterium]
MPLKTDTVEEPAINLTPMIDVVFLLIIFFMVGAQFTEMERQLDVQLPTAAGVEPLTARPDPITINVAESGVISVRDEVYQVAELEAFLRRAKENYPDQAVLVRGAAQGPYQNVIDVLAVCRRVDISAVNLAYRPHDPDAQEP